MKKLAVCALVIAIAAPNWGCGMSNTKKGAIIGAGAGGTIGGIIGHQSGNTAVGAIIGAAVGGAAGAYIPIIIPGSVLSQPAKHTSAS